jgi:hypothetical protein
MRDQLTLPPRQLPTAAEPFHPGAVRLARLKSHLSGLKGWQEESEHAFIGLGDALQRLHGQLQEARNIMAHVTGAILDSSTQAIRVAFADLGALATGLAKLDAQRRACSSELCEHIHEASSPCADLDGTLYLLGQLVTLGQINAAMIDVEGQDFEEFIEEVGRFIDLGRTTVGELRGRLRHLNGLVTHAWVEEHRFAVTGPESLTMVAGRLHEMAERIQAHQDSARVWAEEAGQQFETFQRQVGDMVMGLQFHDIVRQRLEHIGSSIERLLRIVTEGRLSEDGEALSPGRRRHAAQTIARLEAAQLEYVGVETLGEMSKVQRTVTDLAATAALTEQRFSAVTSGRQDEATQDSLLVTLELEASAIERLLHEQQANRERMLAGLAEGVEHARTIAAMVDRLKRLQDEIRIAGLNAIIKSTNLGPNGDALQTIARQMSSHSVQIRQASALLLDRGAGMESTSATLTRDILEPAGARAQELSCRLAETVARLRAKEEEVSAAQAQVRRLLRGIAPALKLHAGFEQVRDRGHALMLAAAAELDAVSAEFGPAEESEPWPELDAMLLSRYTMQREREVHASASGGTPTAPMPVQTMEAAGAADDLDDILF